MGATLARGDDQNVMQATAINTEYLKGAADMATKLGSGSIHAFIGSEDNRATFFTFTGAPDTCLVIMPMRAGEAVSDGVVKILGRSGVDASIAAFRAHLTRTTKLLASATSEKERAELEDRRAGIEAKIAHLINVTTSGPKQLTRQAA